MAKGTARVSAKVADVTKMDPKLGGSFTITETLDNGLKCKAVISDKAVKMSSLAGVTMSIEKPGAISVAYSFDSNTTKTTVFGKTRLSDYDAKGKITYNQKGDSWTAEGTVDLGQFNLTAGYDLKSKETTLSSELTISGIDLEPEYNLKTKEASISASKTIKDIPMTLSYDFSSQKVELEAKVKKANVSGDKRERECVCVL